MQRVEDRPMKAIDLCRRRAAAPFYLAWLLVMLCSVALVHQHHVANVASGLALVAIARVVFPLAGTARA